jgi:asparagine synthase (glutamine-hydrolysing)
MCGVCGLVWKVGERAVPSDEGVAVVRQMMRVMVHRGPDGSGIHASGRFVLGHVRLAIIDVEGAPQPMLDRSKDIAIVYNGEVYNFHTLMDEYAKGGWAFSSRSDTETLLAGYAQDGSDFDLRLNGMYAYAIADSRPSFERLQLGVDPIGIKPLYHWEDNDVFLFASELQGIIAALRCLKKDFSLNKKAVASYLTLGWVPQPDTLLTGVRKLLPGGRLQVDLRDGYVRVLPPRPIPAPAAGDLRNVLEGAVRRQIVSDVPLGFFLSGGIDSSLLVAMARGLGVQPQTFTVRFIGDGHGVSTVNEADVARAVAKSFGTHHRELEVSAQSLRESMDDTFAAMDQPIADPACLPLLCLSRFARQHVKVCLTGDGGDELFHGYPQHIYANLKGNWQRVPSALRAATRSAVAWLPTRPTTGFGEKLRKFGVGFDLIDNPAYAIGPFSGRYGRFLEDPPVLPSWASNVQFDNTALLEADIAGQLSGQLLPKTDHIGMYASLECRVPYLDLEVIAYSRSLSVDEKTRGLLGKVPLRALLREFLPPEIVDRPKQGFRVPLTDWFRVDMANTVKHRLLDERMPVGGVILKKDVEYIVSQHIAGHAEHSIRIWAMLSLQSWLNRNNV